MQNSLLDALPAEDLSLFADLTLGCNRQTAGSAAYVENRFAGLKSSQAHELHSKSPRPSVCQQPHEQVVTDRPMQHEPFRRRGRFMKCRHRCLQRRLESRNCEEHTVAESPKPDIRVQTSRNAGPTREADEILTA